jgi:hypothetical protein
LDAAAWLVAKEIMGLRCGRARTIFDAWLAEATNADTPEAQIPHYCAIPVRLA